MRVLDIDMDYFMEKIELDTSDACIDRLSEERFGGSVWTERRIRAFIENNLGLTGTIEGRVVKDHNESLTYWQELIDSGKLTVPFEVVHVDSHADLGCGYYDSLVFIYKELLSYPVNERPYHNCYTDFNGIAREVRIGDYLLFAIAYRWISKLTYCANPKGDNKNDILWETLKDFEENYVWSEPVKNVIQLLYNPNMVLPYSGDSDFYKKKYISESRKEPEVELLTIPNIENVVFDGNFDYIVLAQSPNYTPKSADFIIDIFREYIDEC